MKKNNLVLASIIMLVFTVISKISGFLREMVLAYFYGASNITDAYITATTISNTIFAGITVAIATSYIPLISNVCREKRSKTTSNIINTVLLIILSVSVLGTIFIKFIVPFFAIGFDDATMDITISMARIILPFSFLYTISNILSGYLQFNNTFWSIGVSTVINNVINMIAFAVSKQNVTVLAIGFVMSWIMPAVFFFVLSYKKGFRYTPTLDVKDDTLKQIVRLGIPIFLGQLVFQFNTIVDRNFASTLEEGTLSAMKYANQLNLFVVTIFVISITTAIFPSLARLVSENDMVEFKKISQNTTSIVLLFVIPITAAFFVLARPIVEIVFMRGAFDMEAATVTSNALMIYAFAIPGVSMNEILNKQFYALKDTKTPVYSSLVSLTVNIVLNFMLINTFGYRGLAASTAIANTILAIILYFRLYKKIGNLGTIHLVKNGVKMVFSAFIMTVCIKLLLNFVQPYTYELGQGGSFIEIVLSAGVGAVTYFILLFVLRVSEVYTVLDFVKNKIARKA